MRFHTGTEAGVPQLRNSTHLYAVQNILQFDPDTFTDDAPREVYIANIAVPNNWCGHHEIFIVSQITHNRIVIFNGHNQTIIDPLDGHYTATITLIYSNNNHYDLAVPLPGVAFQQPPSPDFDAIEQALLAGLALPHAHAGAQPVQVYLFNFS
jgi:hypothetical protein